MTLLLCRCRNQVGVQTSDGQIEVRHRGRTIRFRPPAWITCEVCGHVLALDNVPEPALA